MKVLLDHNLPRRFRQLLANHEVRTTREMGWEEYKNGSLLSAAGNAGFGAFVSIDKNIEHEQNLLMLPLPTVVINAPSNALPARVPFAPYLCELLKLPLDRMLYIIEPTAVVVRLTAPRQ